MNFNDAFQNINDDIDGLARDMINKRKKLYSDVRKTNQSRDQETIKCLQAYENEPGFQFSPSVTYKGDFSSGMPRHMENESQDGSINSSYSYSQNNSFGDSISFDGKKSEHFLSMSDNNNSDSDIISEYSYLPKNKKKHIRMNTKHLQNYKENDEQLILDHIQKCEECKQHLLYLLKNESHFVHNKKEEEKKEVEINTENVSENSIFGKINYKEIKEVIILIIIGIIIIFVLDIFLRR
jgi:hypothetical protein